MKKPKRSTVKARLWKLVSRYIRTKYLRHDGYIECVCCGSNNLYSDTDAGHFIPKARGNSIYFVEENIHPQCQKCNRFDEGNKTQYTLFMIDTYGREKVEELEALSRTRLKLTVNDLLDLESEFKAKLDRLVSMDGDKWLETGKP